MQEGQGAFQAIAFVFNGVLPPFHLQTVLSFFLRVHPALSVLDCPSPPPIHHHCPCNQTVAYPLAKFPGCWNASNTDCKVADQQCSFGCVQNADAEVAAMANFPNIRLYPKDGPQSSTPLAESPNSGWKLPADMGASFSAMCWFFGRDLYTALAASGAQRPVFKQTNNKEAVTTTPAARIEDTCCGEEKLWRTRNPPGLS